MTTQVHMMKTALYNAINRDRSREDWFTVRLFRLMLTADENNLDRLAEGFPDEVLLLRQWRAYGDDVLSEDWDPETESRKNFCNDCGRRVVWDEERMDYRHTEQPERGCFLIAAEEVKE